MTWNININGHDDLTGDEKAAYENVVVDKARALSAKLAALSGGQVTTATVSTNTTGSVNLLAPAPEASPETTEAPETPANPPTEPPA